MFSLKKHFKDNSNSFIQVISLFNQLNNMSNEIKENIFCNVKIFLNID